MSLLGILAEIDRRLARIERALGLVSTVADFDAMARRATRARAIDATDAPPCPLCGTLMQRTGACDTCPACGTSGGCA